MEAPLDMTDQLAFARRLEGGDAKLSDREKIVLAKMGPTRLRASVPRGATGEVTVVVALHGASGDENLLFDG